MRRFEVPPENVESLSAIHFPDQLDLVIFRPRALEEEKVFGQKRELVAPDLGIVGEERSKRTALTPLMPFEYIRRTKSGPSESGESSNLQENPVSSFLPAFREVDGVESAGGDGDVSRDRRRRSASGVVLVARVSAQ